MSLQKLKVAQNEYTEALVGLAVAKFELEGAKWREIIQGVEGKNQAERDAQLKGILRGEYLVEHRANVEVIKKRGAFENATRQFEFDGISAQM